MTHGSLFSGIGGFDLAAQWMDWENVFHCEWNDFGKQILKYYWPNAITYDDITKTDFTIHRGRIDVLTGGFPCQPYSVAGKRKGKEDERHLWPEMLRAIKEIAPSYIVGENVYGLINWNDGLVFNEVQTDLENEGYEVQPYILPAASVNAPHKRARVWFVAYSHNNRKSRRARENESKSKEERLQERNEIQQPNLSNSLREFSTKSSCERCNNRSDNREERQICDNQNGNAQEDKSKRNRRKCRTCEVGEVGNVTNTNSFRLQRRENGSKSKKGQESNDEQPKGCNFFHRKEWEEFPTQTPICNGDDGLSSKLDTPTVFKGIDKPRKPMTFPKWRTESVKGGGNAIVPQVALRIFKTIELYDSSLNL